ncbi:MAG: rsmD [Dehalococcoidia bacterium]|nr:rsmD [Dehalococcoidia bacterium]
MRVIAGEARGRRIGSLKRLGARPTTARVRSALFSILESFGLEGKRVVDLYAGTGTLGIEALSRGALWADFVEASPKRCALLRETLNSLGFSDRARVHCMKVERAIESLDGSYNLILMDPPYTLGPVHDILDRVGALAADGAVVAAGHSRHHPLEPRYNRLGLITERRYGDTVCSIYREGGNP